MQCSLSALCACRNLCHFLSYLIDVERGSPLTFPRPTYHCSAASAVMQLQNRTDLTFSHHRVLDKVECISRLVSHGAHAHWLLCFQGHALVLQWLFADVLNRMSGVVLRVSSCRHPFNPPGFSVLYCMSKSAEDCMEHAEEVWSAPLFDACLHIWMHEAPHCFAV